MTLSCAKCRCNTDHIIKGMGWRCFAWICEVCSRINKVKI